MKSNRFLIFIIWGILLQSPFLYDIFGQSLSDHDIIISGYNPNNNSFRFLALNDIPPNTQIFFTDDLSLLDPLDQFNSNIQTHDYGKLEGLLIFESEQKIEFGTEIIWIGGEKNELFKEFGTFYLSMIKDQIIIFQYDLSESLISGISYGPVEDQTRKIITSNKGIILTLFNGIGQSNLIYPEIVSKNDLLKYYSNENNWSEYKEAIQNRPRQNNFNKIVCLMIQKN